MIFAVFDVSLQVSSPHCVFTMQLLWAYDDD